MNARVFRRDIRTRAGNCRNAIRNAILLGLAMGCIVISLASCTLLSNERRSGTSATLSPALSPLARAYRRTFGRGVLAEFFALSESGDTGTLMAALGPSFAVHLSGTLRPAVNEASFTMSVSGAGVLAQALAPPRTAILAGSSLYLQTPPALTATVGSMPWIEFPASTLASFLLPLGSIGGFASQVLPARAEKVAIPARTSQLAMLALGNPAGLITVWDVPGARVQAGNATLPDGLRVRKYQVAVDVAAARRLHGIAGVFYRALANQRNLRKLTFTIEVDSAGIVRFVSLAVPAQVATSSPSTPAGQPAKQRGSARVRVNTVRSFQAQPAISFTAILASNPNGSAGIEGPPPASQVGSIPTASSAVLSG
ncbi:MAG: hypothetical protein M0008_06130 [Actinomycetota bacterium]|nr:hypothetical protein [Actinomycetota bacterium]